MARAYSIFVVTEGSWPSNYVVAAFTVKHELVQWFKAYEPRERFAAQGLLRVTKVRDGGDKGPLYGETVNMTELLNG
jgi:hypothetical protein